MPSATFRFYAELNEFLAPDYQKKDFPVQVPPGSTVKDLIEALGVPAGEVDLVLVNGRSRDFRFVVCDGVRVSVYPVFERLDVSRVTLLPGRPLRRLKFLAEAGLEGLVAALRSRGMDVTSHASRKPRELISRSIQEGRILLCTNQRILEERGVTHAVVVQGSDTQARLASLIAQLDLSLPPQTSGPGGREALKIPANQRRSAFIASQNRRET